MKKLTALFLLLAILSGTFSLTSCEMLDEAIAFVNSNTEPAVDTETETDEDDEEFEDHEHIPVVDEAVMPTCTEKGLTEGTHCSICDKVLIKQKSIKALGHTEEEREPLEPDCMNDGHTGGVACKVCNEPIQGMDNCPPWVTITMEVSACAAA